MTEFERPVFGAQEVIEITSKFQADDAAFIIGGQATNFWAWFYGDKEPELKLKGPFTSEDIDYFGMPDVARNVAKAIGGKLLLPEADNHTPNTAQIETTINGKPLIIDFLGSVLGVPQRELSKGVSEVQLQAQLDGAPATALIKVLHPLLCLKSRIVNMLHPAMRRSDRIARTQAEAAIVIVRRYIDDALSEDGDWKEARECFSQLFRDLRSDRYVKIADAKLNIDPLDILKHFANDERIDPRYRKNQLQKMIAQIERRRSGRHDRWATQAKK